MKDQATKRNIKDLTAGPLLTWDNKSIKEHQDSLLELDGAEIIFGGAPLKDHKIPAQYGSW